MPSIIALAFVLWMPLMASGAAAETRPNILMIVIDDMGFSDWGAFGGEIKTPHIDRLAQEGVRLTNFYVSPTCSPTRAMLMTGMDHHLVGLGTMAETLQPNQRGKPGYEGYLNDRAVTLPQLLRDAGYATMMAGKWHLGEDLEQDPSRKGFERSFALLEGGASHFADEWMLFPNYTPIYRENGERVHLPDGFYSSRSYTERLIQWLKEKRDNRPFFAYLPFTAPHDPLHAPDDKLSGYTGAYDMGYDVLAQRRLARMKSLGIVSGHAVPSPRPGFIPGWGELSPEERKRQARAMEIYAAMVETIDDHVGHLIGTLKELGRYEDTMVVVFSDNGANGQPTTAYPGATAAWLERNSDNRPANLGKRGSRISTGPGWALASMAPFRMFKTFVSEGGMRSPLIVRGPLVTPGGRIEPALADVRDIMPTILEMAGTTHPSTFHGRDVLPLQGGSMVRLLQGRQDWVHPAEQAFGYELFGWRGIRHGPWKATWIGPPVGPDEWQLFNLEQDPGETTDLARERPDQLETLTKLWDQYVNEMGVVLPVKPSFTAQ